MTTEFALEQLERKSLTFAHTKSVLTFIKQVKLTRELTLPVSTVPSKTHGSVGSFTSEKIQEEVFRRFEHLVGKGLRAKHISACIVEARACLCFTTMCGVLVTLSSMLEG